MKTLKTEKLDGSAYRDLPRARVSIGEFIKQVCTCQRLRSVHDFRSPMELEADKPWNAAHRPMASTQVHCP